MSVLYRRQLQEVINQRFKEVPGKPVLITGMKCCGKSTLAKICSAQFRQFIVIDLNTTQHRRLFEEKETNEITLKSLFFLYGKDFQQRETLIFLKELYRCDKAIDWFRHWITQPFPFQLLASSSFLSDEIMELIAVLEKHSSHFYLPPLTFSEFLDSGEDLTVRDAFRETPVPRYAYEKLLKIFHLYSLTGGMPGIVASIREFPEMTKVNPIYEKILEELSRLVHQESATRKTAYLNEEVLQNIFPFAASRILFNNFGNVGAGSREIARSMNFLARLMVIQLIYPIIDTGKDAIPKRTLSPRLHIGDTGLVNYFSGIQHTLYLSQDMNSVFRGQIARQVVGQELLSGSEKAELVFWTRAKSQSTAEVDFIVPFQGFQIPVVVRSGEPGKLRSLHMFLDEAPHAFAVRLWSGPISIGQHQTIRGKRYFLLNLPYFLSSRINEHLKGFIRLVTE